MIQVIGLYPLPATHLWNINPSGTLSSQATHTMQTTTEEPLNV